MKVQLENSVCVIGLGYTGLPTAVLLASKGWKVTGVDVKASTVDAINRGSVPFVEPELENSVRSVVGNGNLVAQTKVKPASYFIIAVPTPFNEDRTLDASFILSAAESLSSVLVGGELIILESTSPPGTTQMLADYIASQRPDLSLNEGQHNSVYFAHCPERVLPGKVMQELVKNNRVVGGISLEAGKRAKELYETFSDGEILLTDAKTAEMAKLAENAFRDVNIAFANELSVICDDLGIDVWEMIRIANKHPRVNILSPGPGVGGHCIAVDPWFIVSAAPGHSKLIQTARMVNDSKPHFVVDQIMRAAGGNEAVTIAALGIAFKANIDDVRESPAVEVVKQLSEAMPNATLQVVDPWVQVLPAELNDCRNVHKTELSTALNQAKVVALLVDHDEFKKISMQELENFSVIDTRGIWACGEC